MVIHYILNRSDSDTMVMGRDIIMQECGRVYCTHIHTHIEGLVYLIFRELGR